MRGRVTLVNLVYNLFGITLCSLARISGQNELMSGLGISLKPLFNRKNASLTTTGTVVGQGTATGEEHPLVSSDYASNLTIDFEEAQGSTTISIAWACVHTQSCKFHRLASEGIQCSDLESAGV